MSLSAETAAVAQESWWDSRRAVAGTWWTILRICLEERLVYRGDFALVKAWITAGAKKE